ncbi:MAG: prepilin-type N-terminal cleavage/methylation domain-containing protein [Minisyncoccia bacterium]|jgi:prepilin-type N-terminal cleavage/methylation domain-containing protein
MKNRILTSRGFTLIELMVVVVVITLLSGIIYANFSSSRGKARDAQRVSDAGQIQLALGLYYDRCGQYPATLAISANSGCPSGITLGSYISQIPVPPTSPLGQTSYGYIVNTSPATDYVIYTQLEYYNDVLKNSLADANKPAYASSITCYNGSNLYYCKGPR